MKQANPHSVSSFALDAYVADGRRDAAISEHLATCDRCRAYLAELDAIAAEPPPAWNRAATRTPRWRKFTWAIAPIAAAAAALLFLPRTHDPYVGAKGAPAVQAVVRNAQGARIWDGRAPLRAGDAIALRASCAGFARVSVAVPGDRGWNRVYESACLADASTEAPLPFTLVVDDAPGTERVAVLFSAAPLDDASMTRALADTERSRAAWVVPLVFPKAGAPK